MKHPLLVLGSVCIVATACAHPGQAPEQVVANGNADRGRAAIDKYGCGACHDIPGVRDAHGMVGPPLIHWSERRVIAGEVSNTPDHLITWITMPQSIEPGDAMPNMGISDAEARDIAAYLYTLK